jgi:hypothetical protein
MFSFNVLLIKITSRKWWIWLVTTVITAMVLFRNGDHDWIVPVIVVWGIVTSLYFVGDALCEAIATAVSKAEIKVNK